MVQTLTLQFQLRTGAWQLIKNVVRPASELLKFGSDCGSHLINCSEPSYMMAWRKWLVTMVKNIIYSREHVSLVINGYSSGKLWVPACPSLPGLYSKTTQMSENGSGEREGVWHVVVVFWFGVLCCFVWVLRLVGLLFVFYTSERKQQHIEEK